MMLAEQTQNGPKEISIIWTVLNFFILGGGIAWLTSKYGAPLLTARSKEIKEGLAAGEKAKAEADKRAAEVQAKLANLEKEIAGMREEAKTERDREAERIRRDAEAEIARMRAQAEFEIRIHREARACGSAARRRRTGHRTGRNQSPRPHVARGAGFAGTGLCHRPVAQRRHPLRISAPMISTAVVTRYANALADVVLSPSSDVSPQDAARQLRAVTEAVEESSDLRAVLASPAVPVARKRVVLKDITGKLGTSRTIRNFILVLSDHRRMTALVQVLATVENIFDERAGFVRGDVKSAVDLSAAQQGELSGQLSTIAGQPVRLHFSIDPALIGGVTAKIGSKVYDGSVRGQLAEMGKRLSAKA